MQNKVYDPSNSQEVFTRQKKQTSKNSEGMEVRKGTNCKMQIYEERAEHLTTRHKAGAKNQEVIQRTEHASPCERSDLRDLYQLTWINQHKMQMFSPSYALLVIFGEDGQGAGENMHV